VELDALNCLSQSWVPLAAKKFHFGQFGHELPSPEGRGSARPPFLQAVPE
jgi:hypothetical protein